MCGCRKKVSGMAKRKYKGIDLERLAKVGAGAIGAKIINGVAGKALASMPPQTQQMARKGLPLLKVAAGGYLLATSKSKMVQDMALGVVAVGALETVEVFAPQVFNIGSTGDLFTQVGNTTTIEFPVLSSGAASALPLAESTSYGTDLNMMGYEKQYADQMATL